jgi:glycosyltransferase involved in cell wall biosynthesis
MAGATRAALGRADAVLADTHRDIRLAHEWGFPTDRPTAVLPGGGGVRTDVFYPPESPPPGPPRIIQPRGLRAYVENEAFLRAVPAVLASRPEVRFICPGLAGNAPLENLVAALGIGDAVDLHPSVSQDELAGMFRSATIVLSPTNHDGTPNSLLEAMACGCFPVAGDLESIREWIDPGGNGLLVDASSPDSIAHGLLDALADPHRLSAAREHNFRLISNRGLYEKMMPQAAAFYSGLL